MARRPLWTRSRLLRRTLRYDGERVEVPLGSAGERAEQALFLRPALEELPEAQGPYRAAPGGEWELVLDADAAPVARTSRPEVARALAGLLNRLAAEEAAQPGRRGWFRPR